MQRERAFLDWPLLVGLCAVTLDLMIAIPSVPRPAPAVLEEARPPAPGDTERVEDELAAEFRRVRIIGLDPSTAPMTAFEALSRARTLAVVLELPDDGALIARMRLVAPEAAAAYRDAGDAEHAELAQHTAEMVGAP